MKKIIKGLMKWFFEAAMICVIIVGTIIIIGSLTGSSSDIPGTNYTSQQIDNFEMTMTPDTSQGVRLMPDHVIKLRSDSVLSTNDTIKVYSVLGSPVIFSKRYKFSITTDVLIWVKILGPGTDSIRVNANGTFTMDYLHPKFDSVIVIMPVTLTAITANYDFASQGR